MKLVKDLEKSSINQSGVTDKEAEDAFKTILKWIGENPDREGLKETPKSSINILLHILLLARSRFPYPFWYA